MYGLDDKVSLKEENVKLAIQPLTCTALFLFFPSSHTGDLNFCVHDEPPTSINDFINMFSAASRTVDKT